MSKTVAPKRRDRRGQQGNEINPPKHIYKKKGKGPGPMKERIARMREALSAQYIKEAEELVKTKDPKVVQLAWYMVSQKQSDAHKIRLLEQYQVRMDKLKQSVGS